VAGCMRQLHRGRKKAQEQTLTLLVVTYVRNVRFEDQPNYTFLRHPTRYACRRYDHRVLSFDSITRHMVKSVASRIFRSRSFREDNPPKSHAFVRGSKRILFHEAEET
jgi:hypothetical protein